MTAPFSILLLILTFGLVARTTRLLVDDAITASIRHKIQALSNAGGKFVTEQIDPVSKQPRVQGWVENPRSWRHKAFTFLAKVLDCGWCCSVWVSAATVYALWAAQSLGHGWLTAFWYVAAAGTASLVAGLVQTWTYSKEM